MALKMESARELRTSLGGEEKLKGNREVRGTGNSLSTGLEWSKKKDINFSKEFWGLLIMTQNEIILGNLMESTLIQGCSPEARLTSFDQLSRSKRNPKVRWRREERTMNLKTIGKSLRRGPMCIIGLGVSVVVVRLKAFVIDGDQAKFRGSF